MKGWFERYFFLLLVKSVMSVHVLTLEFGMVLLYSLEILSYRSEAFSSCFQSNVEFMVLLLLLGQEDPNNDKLDEDIFSHMKQSYLYFMPR